MTCASRWSCWPWLPSTSSRPSCWRYGVEGLCAGLAGLPAARLAGSAPSPPLPFQTALDHGLLSWVQRLRPRRASKKLFKRLRAELRQQQTPWPPLNESLFATAKISIASR